MQYQGILVAIVEGLDYCVGIVKVDDVLYFVDYFRQISAGDDYPIENAKVGDEVFILSELGWMFSCSVKEYNKLPLF